MASEAAGDAAPLLKDEKTKDAEPSKVDTQKAEKAAKTAETAAHLATLVVWTIGGGDDPEGPQSGFADGLGTKSARFSSPKGITVDTLRDVVFIADTGNHRIRRFSSDDSVTTAAGNGKAGFKDGKLFEAEFSSPTAVAVDPSTGRVFVADTGNKRIRVLDFFHSTVTTIAGNGGPLRSTSSSASSPAAAATLNPDDGKGVTACFECPDSLAYDDTSGYLYVGDSGTGLVRLVNVRDNTVSTLKVGDAGALYRSSKPAALTALDYNSSDKMLYIVDGDRVLYLRGSDGSLLLQEGTGNSSASKEGGAADSGATNRLSGGPIRGLYSHSRQHRIFVCDPTSHCVRAIDEQKGVVTVVAGIAGESGHFDTAAERSKFSAPWGIAWDAGILFTTDCNNHCIRMIGNSQALHARKERGSAPCRVCTENDCVIA